MDDCIFCKIVKGEIPCHKVYEGENFFAFLDINPKEPGHTLVIPKEHYKDIFEIPEDKLSKISLIIKKLFNAISKAGFGEGYSLIQSNGKVAGQDVFHIHFHLIPRTKDKEMKKPSEEEMREIANKIKNSL